MQQTCFCKGVEKAVRNKIEQLEAEKISHIDIAIKITEMLNGDWIECKCKKEVR